MNRRKITLAWLPLCLGLASGCGDGASFAGSSSSRTSAVHAALATPAPAADSANVTSANPSQAVGDVTSDGAAVAAVAATTTKAASATPSPTPASQTTPAPVPPQAVTAGSFTVYATPPNPQPYEDYTLTIIVQLPAATTNYLENDLSGTVVGTDGYHQNIDESVRLDPLHGDATSKPLFSVSGSSAQVVLSVPGAATTGVEDTVNIASQLLNESQAIHITFQ